MASWKKLLVSGSNISQLSNDAGYLTSATAFNAFVTASVNGVALIADSTTDSLNFVTGSAGAGLTIVGTAGTDTITFDLSADTIAGNISNDTITNAQLANEFVSFGGISLNLGQTDATPAFDLQDATNYPFGELTGLPALISSSAQVDGQSVQNPAAIYDSSGTPTLRSGITQGELQTAIGVDPAGTDNSTDVTLAGSRDYLTISGQEITLGEIDISDDTNFAVSDTSGQTGIDLTLTGDTLSGTLAGLGTGASPQFTNLTLTGNLTVEGDTINANVTNLDIEDRYILLNSGSSTIGDSGIVFGGANGVAQSGAGLVWDASYNSNDGRLAIVNTLASNATGDTTPNYHIAGVFEGTEANAATAQADHVGNIRVEGTDIFIYV